MTFSGRSKDSQFESRVLNYNKYLPSREGVTSESSAWVDGIPSFSRRGSRISVLIVWCNIPVENVSYDVFPIPLVF